MIYDHGWNGAEKFLVLSLSFPISRRSGICLDSESYALLSYWLADDDIGGEVNLVIVPGKRQLKPIMVATVE
jgi:hypothetical protein